MAKKRRGYRVQDKQGKHHLHQPQQYYPPDTAKQAEFKRNQRRKLKEMFGAKCMVCGYNGNAECHTLKALEFHHLDPSKKILNVSTHFKVGSFADALKEARQQCVLLCANCHREVEDNLVKIDDGIIQTQRKIVEQNIIQDRVKQKQLTNLYEPHPHAVEIKNDDSLVF